jgi:hypothetical protein
MVEKAAFVRMSNPGLPHLKEWSTAAMPENFPIEAASAAVEAVASVEEVAEASVEEVAEASAEATVEAVVVVGRVEFDHLLNSIKSGLNPSELEVKLCFQL